MLTETYTAIMQYKDQMIGDRVNTYGLNIVLHYEDKETLKAILDIARNSGHRVHKRIIGKETATPEMHLLISM